MKVVAVVQARTGSSRLPGKVLARIGGVPMIDRVLGQLRGAKRVHQLVVATSSHAGDDALAAHLAAAGFAVIRGPLDDVLARYALAARETGADVVVRVTGDCPLHSADTVDEVVGRFLEASVDYAANVDPYTRPDGTDVEVFTRAALERAAAEAAPGPDREHVTPFLRRAPDVRRLHVRHESGPFGAHLRWTVDEADDLDYVRRVWGVLDSLGPGPHPYEAIMRAATEVGPRDGADMANRGFYRSLYAQAKGEAAPPLPLGRSDALLARSARVIPGEAQTYSKSWRQHIRGVTPAFLERGEGARVWDADGNEYIDLIQGLLANVLGYAHPEVDRAAAGRARQGASFSLAHRLEIELAERLVRLIPCADMVRFGKNGSDATAGAVRAARAFTGRERVATCGYHGWQDWFIGATSRSAGVPRAVRELAHPFPYGDLAALDRTLSAHPGEFAAVIMEPFTFYTPPPGYLAGVRELAHAHGALLIFDEIVTGFRLALGGAQERFGVVPDLAAFGKGLGNGYPISAIVGRRDVMAVLQEAFVSFTFAGEASSMAAALAVLDVLEHTDALSRLEAAGRMLADGTRAMAEAAGLGPRVQLLGDPRWTLVRFVDAAGQDDALLKALWTQEVTRRGVLILATHNVSAAHDYSAVEHALCAYAEAFRRVADLISAGSDLAAHLDGPMPTPAFRVRG